jgi:hypothetical protein
LKVFVSTGIPKWLLTAALLLSTWMAQGQFYYGLYQNYGKNRVQYQEFLWNVHRFDRIDIYYNSFSKPLAKHAAKVAHQQLAQLERYFEAPFDDRVSIIVFNNLSDLKQSNLIPSTEEDYNTGGTTRIAGNKMLVYFDGNMAHLEQQIKAGLVEVILSNFLYGGFTQSLKNSTLLHLPDWFLEGLISYIATPWTPELDEVLRDGVVHRNFRKLNNLKPFQSRALGHSFWFYISRTYGEGAVKNLAYMTLVSRSIETAVEFVLGATYVDVEKGWRSFYEEFYADAIREKGAVQGTPLVKAKMEEQITQARISPDGRYVAYTTNRYGEYKVYLLDLQRKRKKRIYRGGYRIPQNSDLTYPQLAWHPNGKILAFEAEERGVCQLRFYDIAKKKRQDRPLYAFDKVLSMSYSNSGNQLLFSAVKAGRSDIYTYTIQNTQIEQITNDIFDDHHPVFLSNDRFIVFSSNRTTDTLHSKIEETRFDPFFDLFAYNVSRKRPVAVRITRTPSISEVQARPMGRGQAAFLADFAGVQRPHILRLDSVVDYVDTTTHYRYQFSTFVLSGDANNTMSLDVNPATSTLSRVVFSDNRYRIFKEDLENEQMSKIDSLVLGSDGQPAVQEGTSTDGDLQVVLLDIPPAVPKPEPEFKISEYKFLNEKSGQEPKAPTVQRNEPQVAGSRVLQKTDKSAADKSAFTMTPSRNYRTTFFRENFTIQVDNIFSNAIYAPFTGTPNGDLVNPGFNALFKVGINELFNDYRIVTGFRWDFQPINGMSLAPNSEFFIGLSDAKGRWDKELVLYRRSQVQGQGNFLIRYLTHQADFRMRFPVSPVTSIRPEVAYRLDRDITSSLDQTSLVKPDAVRQYIIGRVSWVYDNTRFLGINLYHGTRAKVFAEYYENISAANVGMGTFGVDLRDYRRLHRSLIWANRLAIGTSFGPKRLMHYLGGVDRQFSPDFATSTPFSKNEEYLFQTVVTNMRGFPQNIRNGSSFAVVNSEVRFPVFRYLMNRPIQSDFVKNFQIIGFFDVGTAWSGPNPFSKENAFNTETITSGPITVVLDRNLGPVIAGTGFGLRTRLLGYFLRFDWAWGIENGFINEDSVFYFSISTDF